MSSHTVGSILVALKASCQLRQLVGYRVKKVVDPPEKENVKCGGPTCEGELCISLCGRRTSKGDESYE